MARSGGGEKRRDVGVCYANAARKGLRKACALPATGFHCEQSVGLGKMDDRGHETLSKRAMLEVTEYELTETTIRKRQ